MTQICLPLSNRIYERFGSTSLAGQGIRPGGLALTQRLLELANLPDGSRIIDVGCGTGVSIEHIRLEYPTLKAVGLDRSSEMLRLGACKNMMVNFARGDVKALPFRDSSADGILLECSLSVMSYSKDHLDELNRVLASDGKLMLTDVYIRDDFPFPVLENFPLECCLKGAIFRDAITSRLRQSGFMIRIWEDHSYVLKDFAVRLIWACGSLDEFWRQMSGDFSCSSDVHDGISGVKPGYYILLACKEHDPFP